MLYIRPQPCVASILQAYSRAWLPKISRNGLRQFSTQVAEAPSHSPFYVTTPIFYVNAAPHIGHLHSMILADVHKRWITLRDIPAVLCTGTDEHGMKVLQAATKANRDPQEFCGEASQTFRNLAEKAGIANDFFIRTTEKRHKEAVQHAWEVLRQKDLIYLSKHEGWYSVSDETFYPQSGVHLVVEPSTGRKMMASIETGKEVEWSSETNYRFRLSSFKDKLLEFYNNNHKCILPDTRRDEVINAVSEGLEDLSVSRPSSRLTWGVPVPGDDTQTIYVWLDALLNYLTVTGYPWTPGQKDTGAWPANVQVIGKDIVRFHCIYWPAFLMALEIQPPKTVLSHAHWTLGHEKMSKSTGNVVDPFLAIDRFGLDVVRFYLMYNGGLKHDSDYGNEMIGERYKNILQSNIGNLMTRIMRGRKWNVAQAIQRVTAGEVQIEDDFSSRMCKHDLESLLLQTFQKMRNYDARGGLECIVQLAGKANQFLTVASPWKVPNNENRSQQDQKHLDRTIFITAEALRLTALTIQAFMPQTSQRMFDMLGVAEDRRTLKYAYVGADSTYGVPFVDLGRGQDKVLFPPLAGV